MKRIKPIDNSQIFFSIAAMIIHFNFDIMVTLRLPGRSPSGASEGAEDGTPAVALREVALLR